MSEINIQSASGLDQINGGLSGTIPVERGCRQGCPLGPIRFTLIIEPLAQKIREDLDIKGILFKGREYKSYQYTDDMLVTLSDPDAISCPASTNLDTILDSIQVIN